MRYSFSNIFAIKQVIQILLHTSRFLSISFLVNQKHPLKESDSTILIDFSIRLEISTFGENLKKAAKKTRGTAGTKHEKGTELLMRCRHVFLYVGIVRVSAVITESLLFLSASSTLYT